MEPTTTIDPGGAISRSRVTAGDLRPLLGRPALVRTGTTLLRGTLLSCVTGSLWLVADDDTDVVVRLDDVASVEPLAA
jgi:hypothetical protein